MMYAGPIDIKYYRLVVTDRITVELGENLLTLDAIAEHVQGDERFEIESEYDNYTLIIYRKRHETEKEYADRIARAEAYNIGYAKHQEKYGRGNNK